MTEKQQQAATAVYASQNTLNAALADAWKAGLRADANIHGVYEAGDASGLLRVNVFVYLPQRETA
jgi:hypothetical protein